MVVCRVALLTLWIIRCRLGLSVLCENKLYGDDHD